MVYIEPMERSAGKINGHNSIIKVPQIAQKLVLTNIFLYLYFGAPFPIGIYIFGQVVCNQPDY